MSALKEAKTADRELKAGKDRGPLHGIPYGAKDLLATKGIPTSWGAEPYKTQMFDHDATVITRLRQAGAILVAKLAMVEIDRELSARGFRAEMTMQVHDELLFDVPADELEAVRALVRDGMENAIALDVPLKVDMGVGRNWLEAHN